jgi:hypothetical protein
MQHNQVTLYYVESKDGPPEITVEVEHEQDDKPPAAGRCPLQVKIERLDRGVKVITSCARCV